MYKLVSDVWIIYSEYYISPFIWGKTVKGLVKTEKEAEIFASELAKELDPKYGISIQKWEIDIIKEDKNAKKT